VGGGKGGERKGKSGRGNSGKTWKRGTTEGGGAGVGEERKEGEVKGVGNREGEGRVGEGRWWQEQGWEGGKKREGVRSTKEGVKEDPRE